MRLSKWFLSETRNFSSASADYCTALPHHKSRSHSSAKLNLSEDSHGQVPPPESLQIDPLEGFNNQGGNHSTPNLLHDIKRSCRKGHINSAICTLSGLVAGGFTPSEDVYWALLKSCSDQKALSASRELHCILKKHGKGLSTSLFDYLVSTLAKCGALEEAVDLFDQLGAHRTILSWTAVILAFTEAGKSKEALERYEHMQLQGIQPNEYTFVALLKACGGTADLFKGLELHSHVSMRGWDAHDFVGSALVSMYGKCGRVLEAETVFSRLPKHNIVSWNVLLSVYAEEADEERMWRLYDRLLEEGPELNERTFVMLGQACCILAEKEGAVIVDGVSMKAKALEAGKRLHSHLQDKGFAANVYIGNILISMFGKCGSVAEAESVLLNMVDHTVVSWTAMISAYNQQDHAEKALQLFAKVQRDGHCLNEWTFAIAAQACFLLAERDEFYSVQGQRTREVPLDIGRSLHADARKKGYSADSCLGFMLVKLYGKCGSIHEALNVFVCVPSLDVGLWNALLSGYVEQKAGALVLQLYQRMQEEGMSPDEQTSVIALQGCSVLAEKEEPAVTGGTSTKSCSLDIGRALHSDAEKLGFDPCFRLGSTLVSMYGKCGSVVDAENVFGRLPEHDNVAWTAMISANAEQGCAQEAFKLYRKMQDKDVILDDGTLVTLVRACRDALTLDFCRQIHFDILALRGDPSLLLTTALIHAYGCCASMVDAWSVFDVLLESDVVSWSALIDCYSNEGSFALSFGTFECMKGAGIQPNSVTFLSLISSCAHVGLVNKGVELFESMIEEYGILPKIDHFVAVVDLLGRVGELEVAEDMLSRFSGEPDVAMWLCLLGACQKHGNVALGKRVFRRAVLLHPDKASAYILMSNIFSSANPWYDTAEQDSFMHEIDTKEAHGGHSVEVGVEELDKVNFA